jgi:hypothetical protein
MRHCAGGHAMGLHPIQAGNPCIVFTNTSIVEDGKHSGLAAWANRAELKPACEPVTAMQPASSAVSSVMESTSLTGGNDEADGNVGSKIDLDRQEV